MTEDAINFCKTTSQVSRRAAIQIASVLPIAVATEAIVARAACAQGGYDQPGPKATELLRSDLLGQANQVQESVVSVVEFQPGRGAPWHMHPGAQEIVYGLDGAVTLEVEGQATKTIKAGEVALTPADVPHLVRNDDAILTARILVMHIAAFLAELLAAYGDEWRGGWIRCSLDKDERKGHPVTWPQFKNVREAWVAAQLVDTVKGYPGRLAFGNPGPSHGKLTRYKATHRLLALCAELGVTPDNVNEHFGIEYEMPSELVQLTSPSRRTPDNPKVIKLRREVAELNEFFAKHTLTHPTIRHIGWVRKFHLSNGPDFRWNKGGRLYSQPPGKNSNYQNVNEDTRLRMILDGRPVVEIDLGSSYLSIFYAWNDLQLDTEIDAYEGILGSSKVDRHVAKFWINASFGNSTLISKWSKDLKDDLQDKLVKKGLTPAFDPKSYPIKVVREKVLQRHPLLERWGDKIRGRVRDYGDLMFTESEVIIGSMLVLMKEHGIPSLPVHDSLIVPRHRMDVALEVLRDRFRAETGMLPRLDVNDPWDF